MEPMTPLQQEAITLDDLIPLMEAAVANPDLESAHERADTLLIRALAILALEMADDDYSKVRLIDRLTMLYDARRKVWWYA